jgi:hypothetical protein
VAAAHLQTMHVTLLALCLRTRPHALAAAAHTLAQIRLNAG